MTPERFLCCCCLPNPTAINQSPQAESYPLLFTAWRMQCHRANILKWEYTSGWCTQIQCGSLVTLMALEHALASHLKRALLATLMIQLQWLN